MDGKTGVGHYLVCLFRSGQRRYFFSAVVACHLSWSLMQLDLFAPFKHFHRCSSLAANVLRRLSRMRLLKVLAYPFSS